MQRSSAMNDLRSRGRLFAGADAGLLGPGTTGQTAIHVTADADTLDLVHDDDPKAQHMVSDADTPQRAPIADTRESGAVVMACADDDVVWFDHHRRPSASGDRGDGSYGSGGPT
jgi:hypothetical protein